MLEKKFPDWLSRMDYQKKQEKLYKSAMQKKSEALRLRLKENFNRTYQEQHVIDYFQGTGFYTKYQLKKEPNMFDTRQSFLRKMDDKKEREKFLDSYKRIHKKPIENYIRIRKLIQQSHLKE